MSINFSGKWTADLSASKILAHQPAAMTITIEHKDPELREEIVVLRADGQGQRSVFLCRTDSREGHCSFDGQVVRGGARWEGSGLVIEIWAEVGGRELHLCDCWSLSPDEQTLYMEHRNDDLAGQRTVLNREH